MTRDEVAKRIREIGIVPVVRATSAKHAQLAAEAVCAGGTVVDADSAKRWLDAGAQFIVSPGFDLETVRFVKQQGTLMMAGALTPTEVINAWKAGSDFVKIFPCGSLGGAKYLKALKAPLPQIPMIPTGGVNLETAADLIRAGAEALGVGAELVSATAPQYCNTQAGT